jgi:DNA (cytosine-5)-methyltransferase 1
MTGMLIDNFAGGGGASTALEKAFGRKVDVAINHCAKALAMHRRNHPRTRHLCEDVFAVNPADVCGDRPIDALWLSPDCTHFSKAKGAKPRSKKIRALAWVAIRWASLPDWQRPRVMFIENVEEFETWGPLDDAGYPIKEREGETYRFWIKSLEKRGYVIEARKSRASSYGARTIRNRLLIIARCDGQPIVWPEETHHDPKKIKKKAKPLGRAPSLRVSLKTKPWLPVSDVIDWSQPCPSIFERKKPLAGNTMRRIARGVMRYVVDNPKPFIVPVTHQGDSRVHGTDEPLRTITTAQRGELALVAPVFAGCGGRAGQSPEYAPDRPINTLTTKSDQILIAAHLNTNRNSQKPYTGVDEPMHTITAGGAHINLVSAFLAQHNEGPNNANLSGRPADAPLSTITTTGSQQGLVAAHLMSLKGSSRRDQPVDEPCPTICAGGTHVAEVRAFLLSYYGNSEEAIGVDSPLHTVTTRDRFGLVTVCIEGVDYVISDIGMRMLTPRELFLAQGFPEDYILDVMHEGKRLTKSDLVRLVGNSVSPPWATAHAVANAPLLSRVAAGEVKRRRRAS